MPSVNLNVGNIQMKPNETTLRCYANEKIEVSSMLKKLKNAVIATLTLGSQLNVKCKGP